ncbi:MAG: phage tail tape measure protein [Pirellulaceae bacterium]|nr:phage tail tape measure protein [Pirellulaceae bacterium]
MSNRKDIEAASAYVRLYTKGGEWSKGLHKAGEQLTDFGQRINKLATKLAIAGGAIAAPLVASIKAYVNLGSELQDVSDRVGIQVDALSELRFAADQSGSGIEALEKVLRKMQIAIDEASNGSKSVKQALRDMGLEAKDFIGLSADQQFEKIADALASIPDTGDRVGAAIGLMGKSAAELMPLFNQGAAGIRAMREQARALGLSIDPKQAAHAEQLGDAFSIVGKVVNRLAFSIGAALGPAAREIAAWITKIVMATREWVDNNNEAIVAIAKLAVGIFIVAGALVTVGSAIQFVGFSLFGLAAITKTISIAFLALGKIAAVAIAAVTSPIGIAVTLLAALGGYALYASGALSTLAQGWSALGQTANAAWSGIVAAVAGGDLALAGQIAMSSLGLAWLQVTATMKEAWNQFVDYLYQPWQKASDWIADTMISAFYGLQSVWADVVFQFGNLWDKLTYDMTSAWDTFVSYAEEIWQGFSSFFQQLWADVVAVVDREASNKLTRSITDQKTDHENKRGEREKARQAKADQNAANFGQEVLKNQQAMDAKKAAIDKNRIGMQQTIASQHGLRDKAAAGPDPEIEAKKKEIAAKSQELTALSQRAKDLPPIPGLTLPEIKAPELELSAKSISKVSATGIFSGFAVRSLGGDVGGGSPAERTARATEKTAKNTDAIRKQGAEFTT